MAAMGQHSNQELTGVVIIKIKAAQLFPKRLKQKNVKRLPANHSKIIKTKKQIIEPQRKRKKIFGKIWLGVLAALDKSPGLPWSFPGLTTSP